MSNLFTTRRKLSPLTSQKIEEDPPPSRKITKVPTRGLSTVAVKTRGERSTGQSAIFSSPVHFAVHQDPLAGGSYTQWRHTTVPRNALLGHGVRNRWSPRTSLRQPLPPQPPFVHPSRRPPDDAERNIRFLAAPCNTRLVPINTSTLEAFRH